jgi:Ca2+-binding RTX toxin-like protein
VKISYTDGEGTAETVVSADTSAIGSAVTDPSDGMTVTHMGTAGADTGALLDASITAPLGDNVIWGLAGDDILTGGTGNDYFSGGDGNDILYAVDDTWAAGTQSALAMTTDFNPAWTFAASGFGGTAQGNVTEGTNTTIMEVVMTGQGGGAETNLAASFTDADAVAIGADGASEITITFDWGITTSGTLDAGEEISAWITFNGTDYQVGAPTLVNSGATSATLNIVGDLTASTSYGLTVGGLWASRGANGENGTVWFDNIKVDYEPSATSDAAAVNVMYGGSGVDTYYGGDSQEIYHFLSGNVGAASSEIDIIYNFTDGDDLFDLSQLVTYDAALHTISDFIKFTDAGSGDSWLEVDENGGNDSWSKIALVKGVDMFTDNANNVNDIIVPNSAPTGSVTISGTTTEDQVLTADTSGLSDADGLGAFTYQWVRDGTNISGATSSTYTLVQADVGAVITVKANYTDGGGTAESVSSAGTAAIANVNDTPTGSVTISGTTTEDQTLTASNTLADEDGMGAVSYQWKADGTNISGATSSTDTLTQSEVGKAITVEASYTDGQGTAETKLSSATAAVANVSHAPTGSVVITGTAIDGSITYQWYRGSDESTPIGTNSSTYTLVGADVGSVVHVKVSYTDGEGTAEAVSSADTATVAIASTTGDDIINGSPGDDTIDALAGNDVVLGQDGADNLTGNDGNDFLYGSSLTDAEITAITGANTGVSYNQGTNSFYKLVTVTENYTAATAAAAVALVNGGKTLGHLVTIGSAAENTYVNTLAAGNIIWMGASDSTVEGEWRWDTGAEAGQQFWSGGSGGSAVAGAYSNWGAALPDVDDFATMNADGTWDSVATGSSLAYVIEWDAVDVLDYTVDVDTLIGGAGTDNLYGGGGHDILDGGADGDIIFGGDGSDTLYGGAGIDYLVGGGGNDIFAFESGKISETDIVSDFSMAGAELEFTGSNLTTGDRFGYSIDVDGTYLIVGSPYDDPGAVNSAGSAYIFDSETGAELWTLANPSPQDSAYFGDYVTIDGNYAVVGAQFYNAPTDDEGVAYIYDLSSGVQATINASVLTLTNPNSDANDFFGISIDIIDDFVLVGAYGDDPGATTDAGSVYVFDKSTGTKLWTLTDPSVSAGEMFGYDIDASGDFVAIGAIGNLAASEIYIYDFSSGVEATIEASVVTIDNPTGQTNAAFGRNVAVYGDYVIASAENHDENGYQSMGSVYVFDRSTGTKLWTLSNPDPADTDQFGQALDLYGNYAVIGAPKDHYGGLIDSGSAYIFDVTTGELVNTVIWSGLTTNDWFGVGVAIDDNDVFVSSMLGGTGGTVTKFDNAVNNDEIDLSNVLNGFYNIYTDTVTDYVQITDDGTDSFVRVDTAGTATFTGSIVATIEGVIGLTDEAALETSGNLVAFRNIEPTGSVTFSGTESEGQVLTASNTLADADGLGAITYQWMRNDPDVIGGFVDISGATGSTYTLVQDDVGAKVRVRAYYTDGRGTLENIFSASTIAIPNVNDLPVGSVIITGLEAENSTLHAFNNLTDEDGIGAPIYQWKRDGVDIAGAKGWAYTLTAADIGAVITVTASYTDLYGAAESVTSAGTAAIVADGTIYGTVGDDNPLNGTAGADMIDGLAGNDVIFAGAGLDKIVGNDGDDTFMFESGKVAETDIIYDFELKGAVSGQALDNPNPTDDGGYIDKFGFSVAISDTYALVAAPTDIGGNNRSGSVYVYDVDTGNQLWSLNNPTPVFQGDFGTDVAISGNYAVVGSKFDNSGGIYTGSVFIFDLADTGNETTIKWTLVNPEPATSDYYGEAVDINGNYVVVGAVFDDPGGVGNAGSAYVYDISSGVQATIDASIITLVNPDPTNTDLFGDSVAVYGNYVVVGAYKDDPGAVNGAGSVYVYDLTDGTPSTVTWTLTNPEIDTQDYFGYDVAIDGNYVIVGAQGDDSTSNNFSGEAYVYDLSSGVQATIDASVVTLVNPTPYTGDHFGWSVDISGNYAVVGSSNDWGAFPEDNPGAAYVYDVTTGALIDVIDNPDPDTSITYDTFAEDVAISGENILIGDKYDDIGVVNAGGAYLYYANFGNGDVIDLSDVLSGPYSGVVTDYVQITDDGIDSFVRIDTAGTATFSGNPIATLTNITGITDEAALVASGNLIMPAVTSNHTGTVVITGTVTEDQVLTADTSGISDPDGMTTPGWTYQWKADGVNISGATGSTYTLTQSEVGKAITVVASYTDDTAVIETSTSAATAAVANVNDAPTGVVTISGTATEDQTLSATNTLADEDGMGAVSYQWKADGVNISGATASTYTLTQSEVGKVITAVASYTDGEGTAESVTSNSLGAVINVSHAPTGSVTISGTAAEGVTLTANNTLADADGLGTFTYQWYRGSDESTPIGSNSSTYTVAAGDVGSVVHVKISYTDGEGTAEAVSSSDTATVVANAAPTGSVTISGTATEDQTLTASNTLADTDGMGAVTYQWVRDGVDISGATNSTYTLVQADVGAVITVKGNYTDGLGKLESVSSAGTAAVANINDTPTGTVTITGTATEGQTLTASNTLADEDGLGALSYQWKADGVNISGATSSTYALVQSEVGKAITVEISYTDGEGTAESKLSAATAAVTNVSNAATGVPTISGTEQEGEVLTANTGGIADADGLGAFSYQWYAGVSGNTIIAGATSSTYTLTADEVGDVIKVVVSFTDGEGTGESVTSAATGVIANASGIIDPCDGNITITGTAGADNPLNGTTGDDGLDGLAGNDVIYGNTGNDYLCGGDGNDTLYAILAKDADTTGVSIASFDSGAEAGWAWTGAVGLFGVGEGEQGNVTSASDATNPNGWVGSTYAGSGGGGETNLAAGWTGTNKVDITTSSGTDVITFNFEYWVDASLMEAGEELQAWISFNGTNHLVTTQAAATDSGWTSASWAYNAASLTTGTYDITFGGNWLTRGGNGDNGTVAFRDITMDYSHATYSDAGKTNVMHGGAGLDTYYGSGAKEIYHFLEGEVSEIDVIYDFTDGEDIFDLSQLTEYNALDGGLDINDYYKFIDATGGDSFLQVDLDGLTGGDNFFSIAKIVGVDLFTDNAGNVGDLLVPSVYDVGGTFGDDTVSGTAGADTLGGLAGDDDLYGLAGDDTIYGGDGNDRIFGGTGTDTLYGEAGADTFVFLSGEVAETDVIADFTTSSYTKQSELVNPSPTDNDYFGSDVGIDGNYAVVGARWDENGGTNTNAGRAFVYDTSTNALLYTLENPTTGIHGHYGSRVAIDGNYVIVGALNEDNGTSSWVGNAYVYDLTDGTPSTVSWTLANPNAVEFGRFGAGVEVQGNYAVVGHRYGMAGNTGAGTAYVYDLTDAQPATVTWTLTNPTPESGDYFGHTVAMDGNYIIVGAVADDTAGADYGAAYIYDIGNTGNEGTVKWTFTNPGTGASPASDAFGGEVAIAGDYALVGARRYDNGTTDTGRVYVYSITTGSLLYTLDSPDERKRDYFGYSIAAEGNYAVIGAWGAGTLSYAGAAYVYDLTSGSLLYTVDNNTKQSDEWFGRAVEIDAVTGKVIIGAEREVTGNTEGGSAFIYDVSFNGNSTGDKIDLSSLLSGFYDQTTDDITQFVQIVDNAGNSEIRIDTTGTGTFSGSVIATITGVTGLSDVQALEDSGKLITYSTTEGDDIIYGTMFADTIDALGGNDIIYGLEGVDNLTGNTGDDTIYGGAGADTISGGAGNDTIYGGAGLDNLTGGADRDTFIFESDGVNEIDIVNDFTHSAKAKLVNPSNTTGDSFATTDSVAIDGNWVVVGIYGDDPFGATSGGSIAIYDLSDTGNEGTAKWNITNPNNSTDDYFGRTVDVSGNYVIVGAHGENTISNDEGTAYIYDLSNTGNETTVKWTLINPTPAADDFFGRGTAIDGNYAVVAAVYDDLGTTNAGSVYVYDLADTGNETTVKWTLVNPDPTASDFFGYQAVDISGNYVIVGAKLDDPGAVNGAGSAYIYDLGNTGNEGTVKWTLVNPDITANDNFGDSVAIDGTWAVVGVLEDSNGTLVGDGSVYVYDLSDTGNEATVKWTLVNPNPQSGDEFGTEVAVSGNYAIVGSPYDDPIGSANMGSAYIYDLTTGGLVGTVSNPELTATDLFGQSVAIDGNNVVAGSQWMDVGGTAYWFDITSRLGVPDIIDVADLLKGYYNSTYSGHDISNFVQFSDNAGNTDIKIDTTGTGTFTGNSVASLIGITGLGGKELEMEALGDLVGFKFETVGTSEADNIIGTSGVDHISGGTGNDIIYGLAGNDILQGGASNDTLHGGAGDDVLEGLGGSNTASYSTAAGAVVADLSIGGTTAGNDGDGGTDTYLFIQNLTGSNFGDTLTGNGYANTLNGGAGNDTIDGGYGDDIIYGGAGLDTLTGGLRADTFVFESGKIDEVDIITDFHITGHWDMDYSSGGSDSLGTSADISGIYAVVGAEGYDSGGNLGSGAAYVFDISNPAGLGTPSFVMTNPSVGYGDNFGHSVSIDGNYVLISAHRDNVTLQDSGTAYLFDLGNTGNETTVKWTFNSPTPTATGYFGWNVNVDTTSNYALITAKWEEPGALANEGAAYIYDLADVGNETTVKWTLTNPSPVAYESFGSSSALDGNYAVVQDTSGVYLYDLADTGNETSVKWTFNDPGTAVSGAVIDERTVDLDGNYLVVGARGYSGNIGAAYVYDLSDTGNETTVKWTLTNPDPDTSDRFGSSVAVSGNYAIVGASHNDPVGDGNLIGTAYVYDLTTGNLYGTIENPGLDETVPTDYFAGALAIEGTDIVTGGHYINPNGEAHLHDLNDLGMKDSIDISDIISGTAYAGGTDLELYVQFVNSGIDDSDLQIDADGAGAGGWTSIATIQGVRTGLVGVDADDLEASGILITGF